MGKLTSLTQEEMDNVIYDARFGDLESLTEIFTKEVEPSVIKTIKDEYSLSTPFHMAAANGHIEVLKFLLSLIPDEDERKNILNLKNDSGNTALHWAAYNGHLEIVQMLCDSGSDPFIRNNYNHDVFFEASNNEQEEVDDYLLQKYGNIVEKGIDEDDTNGNHEAVEEKDQIKFSEGTEISKVTEEDKKAVAQMTEQTQKLSV
ncbi:hypothetical protein CAS74_003277 [Pichia kudriavzevii]|uniref:Ankyrin repeat-containing protein YAR1 n=1 Tax=Pichia kudriavzevii TaxID=4909 RepID=A0A099NYJ1_PICKU|nr:uncharacterized protein C5L36_0B01810 [Pichia kudriavzevii]MDC6274009.1 ankyrin repeat domain-containing protein [Lacticaseibacillus paracasei]AWU74917.1 hypothetical protein C5L36_0B01810 [Pichia kudriavzevii]KGK37109.1 hypothetical protein JL09_g3760 [Pichia kudriavzevii]ONH73301.1 Ankyrin repeat-containing protein YAR1 [Pichia kudriavzevii]OUT21162.1 hypothetical protein CAS74_003277 [Pichia kudriavzevii]